MNTRAIVVGINIAIGFAAVAVYASAIGPARSSTTFKASAPMATASAPQAGAIPVVAKSAIFRPPPLRAIPKDPFGQTVKLGEQIFTDTSHYASGYVGNTLRCSNCHIDAGRLAGSAPLWGAYVSYPAYRAKNGRVNTFAQRLQGCFRFSMNGKAPPLGDKVLVALESYAYWMSMGATIDPKIAGRGYTKLASPPLPADYDRGQAVYSAHCELCHGRDGAGRLANDRSVAFPALWGANSFNWGAGMGSVKNAAAFIRANMPLGLGGTLSIQDAWDVGLFMDSHERPQDPRFVGSVAQTRKLFHDNANSSYGTVVKGHLLGSDSVPGGARPSAKPPASGR